MNNSLAGKTGENSQPDAHAHAHAKNGTGEIATLEGAIPRSTSTARLTNSPPGDTEAGNRAILWTLLDRHENAKPILGTVEESDFNTRPQRYIIAAAKRCLADKFKVTLDQIEDEIRAETDRVTTREEQSDLIESLALIQEVRREEYSLEILAHTQSRLKDIRAAKKKANPEIPAPASTDEKGNPEYDPAQLVTLLHPNWKTQNLATHAAAAQRIRDILGEVLCYSANLGWLVYNGRHWQRDDKHATKTAARVATLTQAVRDESATLYTFAAALAKTGRAKDADAMSKAAKAHGRHTKQVESKAFIEGALHLAAGLLAVETEQFDQKPWLIGFQNGTWDKGHWREHRREDFLLHLSPVHLDFDCDRREWQAVLDRITANDSDFALMAQDVCGYIFSAASHLRLLPFFYGPKGTGKSTVTELLQTILGDMAATIDPKKLQDSAARERLGADLWNRRLAACSEAGSQRLEAELLKTLSGGDRLAVRFLFREAFTAPPRHVLLMVTNDPPRIDAYDAALKDRVIALPFIHALDAGGALELTGGKRIEAVRQNQDSPLARGFAAWAMEGLARVWHSQEIHRAKCAATATAQFWADTDQVTPFWETIEEAELLAGIGKSELRKSYETWCETEGARPFNRSQWARACASHGLQDEKRTEGKRFWYLPKVAQVAQKGTFSKDTREESILPHGQFENMVSCATCATNGKSETELQEVEL